MNRGRYKLRVTSSKRQFFTENSVRYLAISEAGLRHLAFAGLFVLGCGFPAAAQTAPATPQTMPAAGATGQQAPDPQTPGTISGTVVDKSGAALVGAIVKLTRGDQALAPDVQTDDNGQYSLTKIAPGPAKAGSVFSTARRWGRPAAI